MKMTGETIIIHGARAHNLKGVDVEIPRGKYVVITGISGSGKSSLAFDTIYAEGQRRYMHPHIFDLIRWLTGSDYDTVFAQVAPNLRKELEVEDMLMAVGKLKDGTASLFDPSWSRLEEKLKVPGPGWEKFPKRMEVNLTITGD